MARLLADGCLQRSLYLIDIGARRGLDVRWNAFGNFVHAIGFEPDASECERLNALDDRRVRYLPNAIGDARRSATFYNRQNSDASGYVPFPVHFYQRFVGGEGVNTKSEEPVKLDSLDSLWPQLDVPIIDFVKIDSEGAEDDILKGATSLLCNNRLLGAEIETRFFHFGDQGNFCDVDQHMRRAGLELYDLGLVRHSRQALPNRDEMQGTMNFVTWRRGAQVLASDALYFRDVVAERKGGRTFGAADADELLLLAALFESYELYDCMAEIFVEFADVLSARTNTAAALDLIAAAAGIDAPYEEYQSSLRNGLSRG